jgi:3-oxoacyl-[acyl-carrier protein] reductase
VDTGLQGRTVLITGASQNMGKLAALTFAREGANLALCTSSKMKELNEVADEARAIGVKVVAEQCDITDATSVVNFVKKAQQALGRVDVAVNAAGNRCETRSMELTLDQWNQTIAVNLTGPMHICRSVIPLMMEKKWGRIINFSGLASYLGTAPAKGMVKHAIVGMTRGLAREFGRYNITANCIAPGGGTNRKIVRPEQPIQRQGQRHEFVSLVVYLASENAGFITGQSYIADGGTYFQ